MMEDEERETLTGEVGKILFPREVGDDDGGFRIFVVYTPAGELVVKGTMPGLQQGMTVSCDGTWEKHRKHGLQFRADVVREVLPREVNAVAAYLVRMKIGLGKATARAVAERFGTEIYDVLDTEPERLREVKTIRKKQYDKIVEGWRRNRTSHAIMAFLSQYGVPAGMAGRIYRHMGGEGMSADGIIDRLRANPYVISEIRGVGFKTADAMAMSLGIGRESRERACAATIQVVRDASGSRGDTIVPFKEALARIAEMTGQDPEALDVRVREAMSGSNQIMMVMHDGAEHVTLPSLRRASERIAKELGRLVSFGTPIVNEGSPLLVGPFMVGDVVLDESQSDAVRTACTNSVVVVTGRPGTGKTKLMRKIIDIADRRGAKIKCCAPTALAARRLAEATGMEATTGHRMLGIGQSGRKAEKIDADVVVMDEGSMFDVFLLADILEAIPTGASLILSGDTDQLGSVGPGNTFRDIIESGVVPVMRLTKIHRQKDGQGERRNGIVEGAWDVIEGRMPTFNDGDFRFVEQDDSEKAAAWIPIIVKRMHAAGTPIEDIQVLSPMRDRGPLSVANLNMLLQAAINPKRDEEPEVGHYGTKFRSGDRVRQTNNNYDLEIVNGDVGYVRVVNAEDDEIVVAFSGDREVVLSKGEFDDLVLNFCGTIHSAQGSEYRKVIVVVHEDHYVMLNRNLLYTGITRAQEQCVIVGSKRALAIAVRTMSNARRRTDLGDLIREEFPEAA